MLNTKKLHRNDKTFGLHRVEMRLFSMLLLSLKYQLLLNSLHSCGRVKLASVFFSGINTLNHCTTLLN